MRSRIIGGVAGIVLLVWGLYGGPAGIMGRQDSSSEGLEQTVAELENRIAGLEARVSQLEQQLPAEGEGTTTEAAEETKDLTGTFSVFYNLSAKEGEPCTGADSRASQDYSGVKEGAVLTVYDSKRTEIASGTLSAGTIKRSSFKASDGSTAEAANCVFTFTIKDVPPSDTYVITFSGIDGDMVLTREELDLMGWHLELG